MAATSMDMESMEARIAELEETLDDYRLDVSGRVHSYEAHEAYAADVRRERAAKLKAEGALRSLRDVMWPPEEPDREWSADTLEEVAHVLESAGYGFPEVKLRKLTEKDVELALDVEPETDCEPDFQNDDGTPDTKLIAQIRKDSMRTMWAWCGVTVRVRWNGWVGRAHLGGCSYKDEAEFRGEGGYFPQMVTEALDDLNASLARSAALLDTIREEESCTP